jgi:cytochrome c553
MARQHTCLGTAAAGVASLLWAATAGFLPAAAGAADEAERFRTAVAPLLAARCGACHGPDEAESGYRVDRRDKAIGGGDSGTAGIVAGNPDASELYVRITTADKESRMPADGKPLTADEQKLVKEWIAAGAVWPDDLESLPESLLPKGERKAAKGADHWAFQPVARPPVPQAAASGLPNPIDAFLAARLAEERLGFNPEADPRTLIRRVSFDLIGLPPTPEEIAAFENACRTADGIDGPYRELVNRLLASPHYGERWARHWLDVVRFAESHGFETNTARPNAWPYRDYVVAAFNEDKPFDQFIREQIAGDAFGVHPATGFLVGGPYDQVKSPDIVLTSNQRADELHDMVSTTASAFLGLTVGCARCHDHKFDPVPQTDYYRIKAVFEGVKHGERPIPNPQENTERQRQIAELEQEVSAANGRLATRYEVAVSNDGTAWQTVASDKDRIPYGGAAAPAQAFATLSPNERAEAESLSAQVAETEKKIKQLKVVPKAYIGEFVKPGKTHRFFRGDPMAPREEIAPGSLTQFGDSWQLPGDAPEQDRRKKLADWIASRKNPLTARVIANRLWHYHFGTGIVDTPSDLGVNGGIPSHPELLDWLASELLDGGWRLKHLHRLIVTSRAYRQSSAARPEALARDSASRLLWRYPPRRLEAEPLRDSILAVSGALDKRMGGPGFDLFEPNTNYVKVYATKTRFSAADFRRMVYQSKPRSELDTFFGAFDCPDAGQVQPKRTVSTTPLQALNMLNGDFLLDQAARFAKRVEQEAGGDPDSQVRRAVLLAFGREATPAEIAAGRGLVEKHGLPMLCRSLYNASEFITIY